MEYKRQAELNQREEEEDENASETENREYNNFESQEGKKIKGKSKERSILKSPGLDDEFVDIMDQYVIDYLFIDLFIYFICFFPISYSPFLKKNTKIKINKKRIKIHQIQKEVLQKESLLLQDKFQILNIYLVLQRNLDMIQMEVYFIVKNFFFKKIYRILIS